MIGKYGLGSRNERGEKWVQWCTANCQVITNTCFKEHPRRLWTWKSPGGDTKNQIDYVTINKRFRSAVLHSKTYPSADCGSDHVPVICKLKVRLKRRKLKNPLSTPKLQYGKLQEDEVCRQEYAVSVKNKLAALENIGESKWNAFKEALVSTAKEVIPKKEKNVKRKWITNEILGLMKERQQILPRNSAGYMSLDKTIKINCRKAKEEWLNEKCAKIEKMKNTDTAGMHKMIKKIAGQKTCSSTGCIKSKDGAIVMEKDKVLQRWTEYIAEVFHDNRGEKPIIRKNMEEPEILKSGVRAAMSKMRNKSAGPDEIVVELVTA